MKNKGPLMISLIALAGCLFSLFLILQLDTFGWDEAHHAFFGTQIYKDLISFNIPGFFAHTFNQAWFQPFHSWLNALFFLVLGRSYLSANLSSLFMYMLLFFLIYKYSMIMSKENGLLIAVIADLLLLTSPFMLYQSSVNMQEMMGAVVILLSLIYYVTHCDKFNVLNYLLLGFILSLVLMVKYHYGILLGASIFMLEASRIFDIKDKISSLRRFISNNVLILAGFAPITALWFLTPPVQRKIDLFLYRFQDAQGGYKGYNAIDRALFYIKSIVSSYTFSFWIGIFLLFAIIYCLKYFKDIKVRALFVAVFVFFAFHSTITLIFIRLFVPVMPAIFLLAGYAACDIYFKYFERLGKPLLVLVSLLLCILISGDLVAALPRLNDFSFNRNTQRLNSEMFFGLVKRPEILFPWDASMEYLPMFAQKPKTKFRDILNYCSNTVPKDRSISTLVSMLMISPYEWYWHFGDWKGTVYTVNDYPVVGKYFWFSEYIIEFEIKGSSPYINEIKDGGRSWREPSKYFKQNGWLTPFASKDFDELGIVVNIYKMKLPF